MAGNFVTKMRMAQSLLGAVNHTPNISALKSK